MLKNFRTIKNVVESSLNVYIYLDIFRLKCLSYKMQTTLLFMRFYLHSAHFRAAKLKTIQN